MRTRMSVRSAPAVAVLAVPGVAEAKKFKTIKSSGTILGHLAQPATAEGYAFAGFVSDSKLGEGATTSQGSFDGCRRPGADRVPGPRHAARDVRVRDHAQRGRHDHVPGHDEVHRWHRRYKGARGSGRTTATQDAEGYTRFEYTQKVKIPKR